MVAPSGNIETMRFALGFAALHVVSADMGENALDLGHATVNGHHGNLGIDGLLQGRGHGIHFVRADDDALHALGDRSFHVCGLLGRGHLAIAFNHAHALLCGFRLEGVHHVNKEREGESRNRGQDLVFGIGDRCCHHGQRQGAGDD